MKTFKRIEKLKDAVLVATENLNKNIVVADIATDHGYLAEALSKETVVEKVIATDISKKCLSKLEKLIAVNNLKKIETIVGDGLEPIQKIDVAVVAGVGGFEIIKMLSKQNETAFHERKCELFVLQPAQNVVELRNWIFENNIFVLKDYVVEDCERFYPIIIIDVSKTQINEKTVFNLWIGRDNDLKDEDFVLFLKDSLTFLEFLDGIPQERIECDETLKNKLQLKIVIENLLKQC